MKKATRRETTMDGYKGPSSCTQLDASGRRVRAFSARCGQGPHWRDGFRSQFSGGVAEAFRFVRAPPLSPDRERCRGTGALRAGLHATEVPSHIAVFGRGSAVDLFGKLGRSILGRCADGHRHRSRARSAVARARATFASPVEGRRCHREPGVGRRRCDTPVLSCRLPTPLSRHHRSRGRHPAAHGAPLPLGACGNTTPRVR